jgi:hypothetical protein
VFATALVQRYRVFVEKTRLAPSSVNVRIAALQKLATEAADNSLLHPAVASAIGGVKGCSKVGTNGLKAKRDRALLYLLLGAGLRREQLVSIELEQFSNAMDAG